MMRERACAVCGKTFRTESSTKTYCSQACASTGKRRRAHGCPVSDEDFAKVPPKECPRCGAAVVSPLSKWCPDCAKEVRREKKRECNRRYDLRKTNPNSPSERLKRAGVHLDSYIPVRRISDSM